MSRFLNSVRLRSRPLGLGVGVLVVAAAGAASLDDDRARFLLTSVAGRRDLAESLRRFDVELTDDEQRAVRTIDDRLNSLPAADREAYYIVLRRFHNWLDGLPERERDGLLARPVEQRLAAIKPLIARYPLPNAQSRSPVDFIQTGGTSIFEVASLCKTWLTLSPEQQRKVDALAPGSRRGELHRLGREHDVPTELRPADFHEAAWIGKAEDRFKEFAGGGDRQKEWIAKLETRINDAAARRKEKGNTRPHPLIHRLAVNLYVQEHAPTSPVEPGRLTRFFEALPSWVQSTFNIFPSEEARRRLTLIYRLIYPAPREFNQTTPAGPGAPTVPPSSAPKSGPAHPSAAKSSPTPPRQPSKTATPF